MMNATALIHSNAAAAAAQREPSEWSLVLAIAMLSPLWVPCVKEWYRHVQPPKTACLPLLALLAAFGGADQWTLPILMVQTVLAMAAVEHRYSLLNRRPDALVSYPSLTWLFIRLSLSAVPLVTSLAGFGTYHPLLTPLLAVAFWKASVAIAVPIVCVHAKAVETFRAVKTAIHNLVTAIYNAIITLIQMVTVAVLSWAAAHVVIVWLISLSCCHVEGGGEPATLYRHELSEFTIWACQLLVHGFLGCAAATVVASRPVTSALFVATCPFWLLTLPKVLLPVVAVVAWSWCANVARVMCRVAERIAHAVCAAVRAVCDAVERIANAVGAAVNAVCDAVCRLVWAVANLLYAAFVCLLAATFAMNVFSVVFLGANL
jgi:hypothetical protein